MIKIARHPGEAKACSIASVDIHKKFVSGRLFSKLQRLAHRIFVTWQLATGILQSTAAVPNVAALDVNVRDHYHSSLAMTDICRAGAKTKAERKEG